MARHKKREPKPTAVTKPATGKPKKKISTSLKTAPVNLTTPTWWYPLKLPLHHSRKWLISITFHSMHVWDFHPHGIKGKDPRLVCRNADGVRGRKPELEHFLSQHSEDMSLK
jgi:hypothetical protein